MSRYRRGREWVVETDPERDLSDRQRTVLDVLRAYGGNRSRVARALCITVQSVQAEVRLIERAGIRVPAPARRGPDLRQRRREAAA